MVVKYNFSFYRSCMKRDFSCSYFVEEMLIFESTLEYQNNIASATYTYFEKVARMTVEQE